jgi:hypothetical protein
MVFGGTRTQNRSSRFPEVLWVLISVLTAPPKMRPLTEKEVAELPKRKDEYESDTLRHPGQQEWGSIDTPQIESECVGMT